MKKIKYSHILVIVLLLVLSCKQEVIAPTPEPTPDPAAAPVAGTANFSKFISVGNSYVAGMQASALYNTSQANSLPKIMATQMALISGTSGGSATFNQPDINSVNGFNPINSVLPNLVLGRLVLYDPDGTGPRSAAPYPAKYPGAPAVTCPSAVAATPALPSPYNTSDFPSPFGGNKFTLNNFGVPLILTAQALTPATGGPAPPAPNPAYSPFYARFASSPSANGTTGSTILSDARAAAGSFYLIWFGFDDVLLYAATGADGASPGTYPMTDAAAFTTYYNGVMATLATGTTFNGVVGNIPDFTTLPYFYTVLWNAITLDAATATQLTGSLATPYNQFLDAMGPSPGKGLLSAAEVAKRKLSYKQGANGVLMVDEDLTDLTAAINGAVAAGNTAAAALLPYAKARQATATDLVPLAAGSVLGTCNGGNPLAVWGVSFPVPDKYMLTANETGAILARTAQFNATINSAVANYSSRFAVADIAKGYKDFLTAKAFISDGVMITPSFAPPTGAFSEDGLHPNSRGYAFTANMFIDAINAKFGSTIPKASLAAYSGTGLPVTP